MMDQNKQLNGIALTDEQKRVAFSAAIAMPDRDVVSNAEKAVKALKTIEHQGGRKNCFKRLWRWVRG